MLTLRGDRENALPLYLYPTHSRKPLLLPLELPACSLNPNPATTTLIFSRSASAELWHTEYKEWNIIILNPNISMLFFGVKLNK